jgi:hypothetical protein
MTTTDPQFATVRVELNRDEILCMYELIKHVSGGLEALVARAQSATGAEMAMWGAMLQFVDRAKLQADALEGKTTRRDEKFTIELWAASAKILGMLARRAYNEFEAKPFWTFVSATRGDLGPIQVQAALGRLQHAFAPYCDFEKQS